VLDIDEEGAEMSFVPLDTTSSVEEFSVDGALITTEAKI